MSKQIEFSYKGNSVGLLEERPKSTGKIKYEPFRGVGHLNMHNDLKNSELIECHINQRSLKKSKQNIKRPIWVFSVFSCPEYGVLNVSAQREKIWRKSSQ